MRLYLGIPTAGAPAKPFVESLASLTLPPDAAAFTRGIVTGNFIPAQRDAIVANALEWNADVVAMCDDDMVLPPDAFAKLWEVLRSDPAVGLAGALYYSRDGLRPMAVDGWDASNSQRGWIPAFGLDPVAVSGVGFGCVLVRASAFARMQPPYFASHVYVERTAGRVRVCNEDYLFCSRLLEAGFATILHPGVRCGHYDRARDAIAPAVWETPEATARRRVLTQTGDSFAMVPVEAAPPPAQSERHVRADVVYIEAS